MDLEQRLLDHHKYGAHWFLHPVPEHLTTQWAAASALVACRTPTQLAHTIADRFPRGAFSVRPLYCCLRFQPCVRPSW